MRRTLALAAASALVGAAVLAPQVSDATATYELNIGSLAPNPSPWRTLLDRIEETVESESDGRINVIIRPPGLMGEVEMVRETRKGERLQGAGVTTAALAEGGGVPLLQVIELPYLFDSYAQADHVLDNVLWQPVSDALYRRGFVMAVWGENGFRSFGTKAKPAKSPSDLAGLKMRAQESDVHMAMYKAFGANAVQKPMTEVLTSLQSGVIDGLDTSPVYILSAGLADPLDYYTLSEHIYQPAVIVYSRRWFDALPDDLKAAVKEPKKFAAEGRKLVRDEADEMVALMPQMGLEVVSLSSDEKAAFRTKARAMHAGFVGEIDGGADLLKKIEAGKANAPK